MTRPLLSKFAHEATSSITKFVCAQTTDKSLAKISIFFICLKSQALSYIKTFACYNALNKKGTIMMSSVFIDYIKVV